MSVKDALIATHLFLENDYFFRYIDLIEKNKNRVKQKYKTQKHHIIPAIAFKLYNWEGIDAPENLVNLLYKDHILAHYYLALATKTSDFQYKMIAAINFILGKAKQSKIDIQELQTFILNLENYQNLYENWIKERSLLLHSKLLGHETSEETRKKISEANKNKIYIYKENIVRAVHKEDLQLFLDNGWTLGNPNCQKRKQTTGQTIIHKEEIEKYIFKEDLSLYLANGWILGRSDQHKKATQQGTQAYYDKLTKEEKINKCATRQNQHWEMSEETKKKISNAKSGKKQSEEQKLLNSQNKKDTIWMTNGQQDIMIKKDLELYYLDQGFIRGRTNYKKNKKGE